MAEASVAVPEAPASGTHLTVRRVGLHDVLEHLASTTGVASSFGAQLERARDGTTGGADYARARDGAEARILARAAVVRCVDALGETANLWRAGEACGAVRCLAVKAGLPEGAAVIGVMRAYQPWATSWPERGLADVYAFARAHGAAPEADAGGETSIAQAFRIGKAKRARNVAALLLADAEVVLHAWVMRWNSKEGKEDRRRGTSA